MKYKISKGDAVNKYHRLIGIGKETTSDNKIKGISKASLSTINKIANLPFFELQNPLEPFHARDNIFLLKEKYTNEDFHSIYYVTKNDLIGIEKFNRFSDKEDENNFDLVGYMAEEGFIGLCD